MEQHGQSPVNILLVEADASPAASVIEVFKSIESVSIHLTKNLQEARASLAASPPDIILADWRLPDGGGIELLAPGDKGMRLPVILMSAQGSEKQAVKAIKAGTLAYFVLSSGRLPDLPQLVSNVLREWAAITGLRQAEEALRQPEQWMRLHIEQTPLAVIEWDTGFRVLQWNPAAEKIFGYTAAEAMGQYGDFILPKAAKAHVAQIWADLMAQKDGHRSTNDNSTKDGKIICCEWYNTPLTSSDGSVIGVASLAQDITEREREKDELQLFKESVESSSDAIGMSTQEGVHYYQNRAFDDLFGPVGPDPCSSLYVVEQVGREVFKTITSGGQWSGEAEMYAKDGRVLNIFLRAYANKDHNDRIIGLVGIHTDITKRKRAEEALRDSEEKFRGIINYSSDGIYLFDDQGIIVEWNATAESITMIARDAALGRPVWDIYYKFVPEEARTPELHEYFRTELLTYISKGKPKYELLDTAIQCPDGSHKVIQCNNFTVTLNNRFIFGVMVRDITQRNQEKVERERLIVELQEALANVKKLSGLLPICSACKKIRKDDGYWELIETYIRERSDAQFTHGICPDCAKKLYPEFCH